MRIDPQTDGTSAHEAGDGVVLEKGRLRRQLTGRGEREGTREGKYGRIQMSSLYLREVCNSNCKSTQDLGAGKN